MKLRLLALRSRLDGVSGGMRTAPNLAKLSLRRAPGIGAQSNSLRMLRACKCALNIAQPLAELWRSLRTLNCTQDSTSLQYGSNSVGGSSRESSCTTSRSHVRLHRRRKGHAVTPIMLESELVPPWQDSKLWKQRRRPDDAMLGCGWDVRWTLSVS
jgi:hypothetical protein